MIKFKIKVLTKLEFLCIDISAYFNTLGVTLKGIRWDILEKNGMWDN